MPVVSREPARGIAVEKDKSRASTIEGVHVKGSVGYFVIDHADPSL